MIALLLTSWAFAQEPADAADPVDLRVAMGDGAQVNWTRGVVEVNKSAQGRGVAATRKAVEASARTGLGDQVQDAVLGVQVSPGVQVVDLMEDLELGALLQVRAGRWSAGETRYFASGRIEVVAEVSLLDFLKPVSLERGVERPEALREPAITGILIDARGTDVLPAWFPEIRAPNGEVLWDGSLWADAAVSQIPVVWVGDPAHMAVARVGEDPLIVHAGSGGPGVVVLDPLDAVRFRTTLTGSAMLRQANMVVVVDP